MNLKRYKYSGHDWPELKEKPFYFLSEISAITGLPDSTLRNRLRNTDTLTDVKLIRRKISAKKLKYTGKKKGMRNGAFYTMLEYAKIAGVCEATMWGRLKDCEEVSDYMLRPAETKYNNAKRCIADLYPILETEQQRVSAKWLKMKLL